jgi:hypothetical protein
MESLEKIEESFFDNLSGCVSQLAALLLMIRHSTFKFDV